MRLQPTWTTLRGLFARSSNRCAFADCTQELVTADNLFVGQVCHVKAAEPGGPRFDPSQTDEQRRSPDNLLLLCYPHHVRVDAPSSTFTVAQLLEMKQQHERKATSQYLPNESILRTLGADLDAYWDWVTRTNEKLHKDGIPAAEFDRTATPLELAEAIEVLVRKLRNVEFGVGPESGIDPQDVKLYLVPNAHIYLGLHLAQLKVRLLEAELKSKPAVEVAARLAAAQKALEELVASSVLYD